MTLSQGPAPMLVSALSQNILYGYAENEGAGDYLEE